MLGIFTLEAARYAVKQHQDLATHNITQEQYNQFQDFRSDEIIRLWTYNTWISCLHAMERTYRPQQLFWERVAQYLLTHGWRDTNKIEIRLLGQEINYCRAMNSKITLENMRTIIPGGWIKREIMNLLLRKVWDESRWGDQIMIMDTHFVENLRWDDITKKLKNYPKGGKVFTKIKIFNKLLWIVPS